ncbi:MAG: DUF4215 domain-containing protein [Streptococcus sp.]|nr:DUF4215 domain-containing protein [Streptococcus sp.]
MESGWICNVQTNFPTAPFDKSSCTPTCGNGKVEGPEICDDGNAIDNAGCKADCSGSLLGYTCSGGNITNPSICTPLCGDGIIIAPE